MAAELEQSENCGAFDNVFVALGVWGRWQILQIGLILSLQSVAAYQLLSIVFLGYEPPFRCEDAGVNSSSTLPYNSLCESGDHANVSSHTSQGCSQGYVYDVPRELSIVTQWDLVCFDEYLTSLSQTVLIGGQAFGAVFFSHLSDRYGRKRVFLAVQWGMLIISGATSFSPNITVFIVFRFITGAFQQGLIMLGTVLPLEITTMGNRPVILLLTGVIWGTFNGSLAGIGYLFRDLSWRYMQAALTGASLILLIPNMLFLDESMRWLVAKGRMREAQLILKKAARMNGARLSAEDDLTVRAERTINVPDPRDIEDELPPVPEPPLPPTDGEKPRALYSFRDIIRNKRLRRFSVIMFFIWIVSSFGYFGLSLEASELAGDRFLNFFLLAIADVPAAIFSFFTMKWVGRRPTVLIFNGLSGLCMTITIFMTAFTHGPTSSKVETAMAIIGKFGISASFGSLFIYTSELFPTTIRGLGCGIASSASRIGGMVAPFFAMLMKMYPLLFPISLASGCGCVCLVSLLLPETRTRELPQTLQDIEAWFSPRTNRVDKLKSDQSDDSSTVKLMSDYD